MESQPKIGYVSRVRHAAWASWIELRKASGQWMPDQCKDNGKRGQERADGGERKADLRGLVLGD